MKVIRPILIGPGQLISSTAPETDYPAHATGANYAVGERVVFGHMVYEALQTPNTGYAPDVNPMYWSPVSATNRYLMFDQEVSSSTITDEILEVVVAPTDLFDSLALLDLVGEAVSVIITDGPGGPEIYRYDAALDGSEVSDWYQYFYAPFVPVRQIVLSNLPLYVNAVLTVSITGVGAIECGSMILGSAFFIGETQLNPSVGIIDYSRKDISQAGTVTLKKGKYSKRMSAQLMVDNSAINNTYRVLADLRATACVWVGTDTDGYDPLTFFGFYRDFSIDVTYPTISYCNIEIEGMTQ